ncbi:MAG: cysteine desulfurase family protein [Caulobacteraceae bacterium]
MSRTPVYLDYNATALVRPDAAEAAMAVYRNAGNPSAIHAAGRRARAVVEDARADIAALIGADPADLVFTSGGTEANALAVHSAAQHAGVERLIVGATEHPCVIEPAKVAGKPVEVWPVDRRGVADLDWLADALKGPGAAFVALMQANNETGVIQPVAEAARMVRDAGGWMHVDAVQAAGKIPVDLAALGAHTLSISAHKVGGSQGCGALVAAPGVPVARLIHGGSQEAGRRSGTENVPGIASFGAAAKAALAEVRASFETPAPQAPQDDAGGLGFYKMRHAEERPQAASRSTHIADLASWRDAAWDRLKGAGAILLGEGAERLPNTLCITTPGWRAGMQVIALDLEGVMVSAGAACGSGKVKPNPSMVAMGIQNPEDGALRVSGGWGTTEADWVRFTDVWLAAHARVAAKQMAEA